MSPCSLLYAFFFIFFSLGTGIWRGEKTFSLYDFSFPLFSFFFPPFFCFTRHGRMGRGGDVRSGHVGCRGAPLSPTGNHLCVLESLICCLCMTCILLIRPLYLTDIRIYIYMYLYTPYYINIPYSYILLIILTFLISDLYTYIHYICT